MTRTKRRNLPIPFDLTPKGWVRRNAARSPGRFVPTPLELLYVPPGSAAP